MRSVFGLLRRNRYGPDLNLQKISKNIHAGMWDIEIVRIVRFESTT